MKKKSTNQESKGLPGGPNEYITHPGQMVSIEGYKRNSPDVNNPYNIIPSGSITMEDVDFPVQGVDNLGNEQMMYPGENYEFPGDMVFETPMYKRGGGLLNKTMECNNCGWEWKAADGGNDVSTCHKCGSQALPKAQDGTELASNCTTGNCPDPEMDRRNRYTLERRLADSRSLASLTMDEVMSNPVLENKWKRLSVYNGEPYIPADGYFPEPKENTPLYNMTIASKPTRQDSLDLYNAGLEYAREKDNDIQPSDIQLFSDNNYTYEDSQRNNYNDGFGSKENIEERAIKPIGRYTLNQDDAPYYPKPSYKPNYDTDLQAYLKKEGKPGTYADRKLLAIEYGITDYSGTAEQNIGLLNKIKNGEQPQQTVAENTQRNELRNVTTKAENIEPQTATSPQPQKGDQVQYRKLLKGYKINPRTGKREPVYEEQGYRARGSNLGRNTTTQNNFKYGGDLEKYQFAKEVPAQDAKEDVNPSTYQSWFANFVEKEGLTDAALKAGYAKKQLTGSALKANKNNPQLQAIQQRDRDNEAVRASGMNLPRLAMQSKDDGSIEQYEEPRFGEQALNYLANPMTTLGYLARGQDLPNFVQDKDNVIDHAMDVINPFAYLDYGNKSLKDLDSGEYVSAGLNALGAIPAIPGSQLLKSGTTVKNALRYGDILKQKTFLREAQREAGLLKQLPGSPNAFKSEINWGNWNKEIPDNPQLMREYNTIEQTSKADGTWMKNVDGSKFNGTPEQFVQQNSENFKKAYPDGASNVYRGTTQNTPNLRNNETIFTANKELAEVYSNKPQKILGPDDLAGKSRNDEGIVSTGGLYDLLKKNSDNSINWDGANNDWSGLDLNNKGLDPKNIKKSIEFQKKHAINQRKLFDEYKQHSDGSWHHPNGKAMSNELYMYEKEIQNQSSIGRVYELENLLNNPNKYPDNIQAYEKMKKDLGSITTTDDIASYIERSGLDNVTIRNINDSGKGDVSMVNHKSGNYLKSNVGNNGMFDMTNPNIYKALAPLIGVGAVGAVASQSGELPENKYGGSLPKAQFGIEPKDYTTFVDNVGPAKSDNASYVSDAETQFESSDEFTKEPIKEIYKKPVNNIENEYAGKTHTVKRGDNLSTIAKDNNTTVDALTKLNNISNPRLIFPNQVIKFPEGPDDKKVWQPVDEIAKKTKEINTLSDEGIIMKGQNTINPSQRYIVLDKKNNKLKVYGAGKMISSMEVVTGGNSSDAQTVTKNYLENKDDLIEKQILAGVNPDGDFGPITEEAFLENNINFKPVWKTAWEKGNKSTGAGIYKMSNTSPTSASYYGYAPSFNMTNDAGIEVSTAIHGTTDKNRIAAFGNDDERKAKFKKLPFDEFWDEWINATGFTSKDIKNTSYDEALNDLVLSDNRMSNGCINGQCEDVEALYSLGLPIGTPIYILPEDKGNNFELVDGKPVLRMSRKNRETYDGKYKDEQGDDQDSQGSNYSINTLTYKPIKANFDFKNFKDTHFNGGGSAELESTTLPFIDALTENKKEIMLAGKIPGDVYNQIAKMTFGIYGAESHFGRVNSYMGDVMRGVNKKVLNSKASSPGVVRKYEGFDYTLGIGKGAKSNENSVGYTQVRFQHYPYVDGKPLKYNASGKALYKGEEHKGEPGKNVIINDLNSYEREALSKFGITTNKDFLDPKKAAIGTAVLLAVRYNQQLNPNQKKDIWKHLPKTWSTRDDYSTRVKNNSVHLDFDQLDKLQEGGEIDNLNMYKNYMEGNYTGGDMETAAKQVYDKLNRVYYKEAKANNTSVPNYIMTNIISKSV